VLKPEDSPPLNLFGLREKKKKEERGRRGGGNIEQPPGFEPEHGCGLRE
jgi:hypothetical protein